MKSGSRSNALLVELLIVVMFFMLSATVLLQVYATSSKQSNRAGLLTVALNEAQNVAERLYASDEPEDTLQALGFEKQGDVWRLAQEDYSLQVTGETEKTESGTMYRHQVLAEKDGETLVTLPVSRYQEEKL
jgi:type II secretory pathway pseudopilin PulG